MHRDDIFTNSKSCPGKDHEYSQGSRVKDHEFQINSRNHCINAMTR